MVNSAIHKAAGSLVTGHSQKSCWLEPPPEAVPPLMASGLEQWNDEHQSNHGTARNREAGGFVNSAVNRPCPKPGYYCTFSAN